MPSCGRVARSHSMERGWQAHCFQIHFLLASAALGHLGVLGCRGKCDRTEMPLWRKLNRTDRVRYRKVLYRIFVGTGTF